MLVLRQAKTHVTPFNPYNSPVVSMVIPIYRWWKWGYRESVTSGGLSIVSAARESWVLGLVNVLPRCVSLGMFFNFSEPAVSSSIKRDCPSFGGVLSEIMHLNCFSGTWHYNRCTVKVKVKSFSRVQLFATLWTV